MNNLSRSQGREHPTRRRRGRRAGGLSTAVAVGVAGVLLPGITVGSAAAADPLEDGLVAQYLFDESAGSVLHNTADGSAAPGDPLDAVVQNYADAQRAEAGTLRFVGGAKTSTGNWVELPDELLGDATSATISIDVKADAVMLTSNHFLWNIGSEATQQYWFANVRGPRSSITTSGAAGERTGTGYALTANRWHSLTAVLDADADTITLYTDGQRSGVGKTQLTPADITQTLNTIGRAPYNDRLFQGSVGAFHVYDRALSDTEVIALSDRDGAAHSAELAAASNAKLAALDLGDTSAVTADLDLFTLRGISWASSDTAVISADGRVTRPAVGEPDAVVTLVATATTRGQSATSPRSFSVTVPALTSADVLADRDDLWVPSEILGNITLPDHGASGAPVSWVSSDDALVSDSAVGAAAAGVVTRPEWGSPDRRVTLTATVGSGDTAVTREFEATVKAAARPAIDERYLFAYFTADTLAGENIHLAASQGNSAMSWDVLNGGSPVLTSSEGTRGLRDPFILRSAEGDRFFLIATDLSIGSGTSWDSALDNGSTYLEIWESTDLTTWSEQRHVEVSGPFASMTWAPEAYWDEAAGEYVVYWSSRLFLDATRPYDKAGTPNYTYSKVMYSTTRDFVSFTPAKVWQEAGDRIDSTVIEDDGTFYRFTKEVTGCVDIVQESSPSLRALTVPGDYAWETDASCISKTARNTTRTTEGPTIFRANQGDTSLPAGVAEGFYLFVDDFTGAGYLPLFSESLENPQWQTVAGALPRSRHGSVLPVTLGQWESAKGVALTEVTTSTELRGVADGDVLEPGATVTARVEAADGGPVAGQVRFGFGDVTVDAVVQSRDGEYVASAVVPDTLERGAEIAVAAAFDGYDVLAPSASASIDVVIGGEPTLDVTAAVTTRCVAGKVTQAVTIANAEDLPVSLRTTSEYGSKTVELAAGKTTTIAFSTRQAAVAAGEVTVLATATVDGSVVSTEVVTGHAAVSCR